MGGEGVLFVVYGDYLYFISISENCILLNMGGIVNLIYLLKLVDLWVVFSFDIGLGNIIMDVYV